MMHEFLYHLALMFGAEKPCPRRSALRSATGARGSDPRPGGSPFEPLIHLWALRYALSLVLLAAIRPLSLPSFSGKHLLDSSVTGITNPAWIAHRPSRLPIAAGASRKLR